MIAAGRSSLDETLASSPPTGLTARAADARPRRPDRRRRPGSPTLGPLDILVNNAGIIRRADAVDFTEGDWDAVIDVNLKAVVLPLPGLRPRRPSRGRRAARSSTSPRSSPSRAASASRLHRLEARRGRPDQARSPTSGRRSGINVNAIAPGYIETNNTEALRADPDRSKAILDRIPAGRWGEAADIAGAAVFLASPAAQYIHGAILPVDGGWLAR